MAVILIIKTEEGEVTELPVLNKIIMGRSSSADFTIKDSKMSGQHCTFEMTHKGQLMFTDLGSTNGSFFNNSRISQTAVKINDVVRVGNTLIRIDEKRLSASERMSIGLSTRKVENEKTLPVMSAKERKAIENAEIQSEEAADKSPKRRTVVLDKSIKEKKKAPDDFNGVDTILDQEASTGDTKMLKLDSNAKEVVKKKK
ncbi:FHA domain-containing protein [Bacteriovorax sp. PP10]|uniref:FHA domain-containing protein n=1 Tax=Bacteriovorax antarcticus TaxID=3088717 RepID=A0ABU5VPB8_9BACT|nr:FHA domain-containing protein [Bacteriovorax sp. PP10]MEA9354874.1 FHA domain-containing protein [Bacteriovorax sp. PP10]